MFDKARWNQLLAGKGGAKSARTSLEYLCHTYRRPVVVYLRRQGHAPDEAEALTHAFFGALLRGGFEPSSDPDRARFRRVLIAALERWLSANPTTPVSTATRAPATPSESGEFFDPRLSAAQHFDRAWALALLERVVLGLAREAGANGHAAEFEALKGFLVESADQVDCERIAARSGLVGSALQAAHDRLRRRLDELVREALSETLENPAEVDDELDVLRNALGGASAL